MTKRSRPRRLRMPGPTQRYTFALLSKNKGRRPYYYYAVLCRRLFSACLYLSVLRVARLGRKSNPLNFKAEERYQRRLDCLPSTKLILTLQPAVVAPSNANVAVDESAAAGCESEGLNNAKTLPRNHRFFNHFNFVGAPISHSHGLFCPCFCPCSQ